MLDTITDRIEEPTSMLPRARGFFGIGLIQPKHSANIGSVLRAAQNFDAAFVGYTGRRYQRSASDTFATTKHKPLFQTDDIFSLIPFGCEPIGVDLVDGAIPLDEFKHPERAFYIFGPEDGTLGRAILDRCSKRIVIPSHRCLNLAAAVTVVAYDRIAKRLAWERARAAEAHRARIFA